jgi:ubiquinone/menaquinone biosynthesis C-methylase UbiE
MTKSTQDQWAQWLLERRHGGDPEKQKAVLRQLQPIRDKVLHNARLVQGETLLDVGCGDGLIAFGALPLLGKTSKVIFSDISQDLLDHCQSLAEKMEVLDNCQFHCAPADNLEPIESNSVDAVTTRSVLIYVAAKKQAFNEFYRVLKPGGRLSIFEPINRFTFPEPPHRFSGYDVTPIIPLIQKIHTIYTCFQSLENDPMMDFDERDLLTFAEQSGFAEIHLAWQVEILPGHLEPDADTEQPNWQTFLKSSPNPLVPTLEEAINKALTPTEIEQFTYHLRPLVEKKQYIRRFAVAYLWAVKH